MLFDVDDAGIEERIRLWEAHLAKASVQAFVLRSELEADGQHWTARSEFLEIGVVVLAVLKRLMAEIRQIKIVLDNNSGQV